MEASLVRLPRRYLAWLIALGLVGFLVYLSVTMSGIAVAAFIASAAILTAVLRWPVVGPALLIASVPVQQAGAFGAGAISLTATRASLLIAIGAYLIALLVLRQPIVVPAVFIPFVAFLLWIAFTAPFSTDVTAALSEIGRWMIAGLAFVVVVQFVARPSRHAVTAVILLMALAASFEALLGSVLGILGFGPESFQVAGAFSRAYGTFGRPNTFAGYLELSLFPVLWFAWYRAHVLAEQTRAYRVARVRGHVSSAALRSGSAASAIVLAVVVGAAGIMLLGIGISFSRGAWLGVAAGLGLTALVALRRYWLLVVAAVPVVVLIAGLVGLSLAPQALTGRLGSIFDEVRPFDASTIPITDENFAVAERMAHWQAAWHMFEDHPLTGVGAGNFNVRYPDYFVRDEFRYSQGHAHNFYIHVLAETGVIGLVLYLATVLSFLFMSAWIALTRHDIRARALALGALGTTTALMVHNVFENLHVLNIGIQLSAVWALAVAAYHLDRTAVAARPRGAMEYCGA